MVDLSAAALKGRKVRNVAPNPELEQKVASLEAKVEELRLKIEQQSSEN